MAAELEAEVDAELGSEDAVLDEMLGGMSNDEIRQTIRALENEVRIMKRPIQLCKCTNGHVEAHRCAST